MFTFFNEHPFERADISALGAYHSGLMQLETWFARDRMETLTSLMRAP